MVRRGTPDPLLRIPVHVVRKLNQMKYLIRTFLILSIVFVQSCCDVSCERKEYALDLIKKIENYHSENNELPENVAELGITETEDTPAFYQKLNDTEFEVWYGIGFESMVYSSKTKKWTEQG